jgi:hypothetical protein
VRLGGLRAWDDEGMEMNQAGSKEKDLLRDDTRYLVECRNPTA